MKKERGFLRRPDFKHMTMAELRAYCSYIFKVGVDTHELLLSLNLFIKDNPELCEKLEKIIKQLEVLGLSSYNIQ